MSVWLADALVVAGTIVITVAVLGVLRLSDVYMKLHAAGKAAALGIAALAAAAIPATDAEIASRALLAAGFLLLTTPMSAHAIGLAAAETRERMRGEDTLDESDFGLGAER